MDNHPLDDRDVIPYVEEEPDESEAYKQEREDERMDEHFIPSEGNVY